MKRIKLLLPAILLGAIVALSMGCPNESSTMPPPADSLETVANPVINPNRGDFVGSQKVTITNDTQGAEIYYTLNGGDPTVESILYTDVFTITENTTVRAIGIKNNFTSSTVVSAIFMKAGTVTNPVINPNGGDFVDSQKVTITNDTQGAEIYYTLNGDDPTAESFPYTGEITIYENTTVKAIGIQASVISSAIVSVAFTKVAAPIKSIVTNIIQSTGVLYNSATKAFSASASANSITFTYDARASYSLPTSASWITHVDGNSGGAKTLTLNISELTAEQAREVDIVFTLDSVTETYTIAQRPNLPANTEGHLVVGYYTSWNDTYTLDHLRTMPEEVTWIFVSFARPNLRYIKGSMDFANTGLQFSNSDGNALKAAISTAQSKGQKVILSVGGETYWATSDSFDIDYGQIADFIKDFGFDGIDWDFEPQGSFANIGNAENVAKFIEMIRETRKLLPRSDGYLVTTAPSGVGALGGSSNDDTASPYRYEQRNILTGDSDANLSAATDGRYSIPLFGFAATGHMIPVLKAVGAQIDMIAYQGYNVGAAPDRMLMYDAYAYYAEIYGFKVAAGLHMPDEPWGPYFIFTEENIREYTQYVINGGKHNRAGKGDGVMFWDVSTKKGAVRPGLDLAILAYNEMNNRSPITAPRLGIASPSSGIRINKGVVLAVELTLKRIDKVEIFVDGGLVHTVTDIASDTTGNAKVTYSLATTALSIGEHTLKVVGGTKAGETDEKSVIFEVLSEDDISHIPAWNADTTYAIGGNIVRHNGTLWSNAWWTKGDEPGAAEVWKPYTR